MFGLCDEVSWEKAAAKKGGEVQRENSDPPAGGGNVPETCCGTKRLEGPGRSRSLSLGLAEGKWGEKK